MLNPYRFGTGTFYRFDATGAEVEFTVPAGVYSLKAYVFGAAGGQGVWAAGRAPSGAGGYSEGEIAVSPGEKLRIRTGVGGGGGDWPVAGGVGGWPGGGDGSFGDAWGGGGGGYSGVFREDGEPIIIAGGGGSNAGYFPSGGAGGGLVGQTSGVGNLGGATGGTQSAGGVSTGGLADGAAYQGAHADNGNRTVFTENDGGGAGGGYYGGGVQHGDAGGGSGGSGYVGGATNAATYSGDGINVPEEAPLTVNGETVAPRGQGIYSRDRDGVGGKGNDGVIWLEVYA